MSERQANESATFERKRRSRAGDQSAKRHIPVKLMLNDVEHGRIHRMAAERHRAVAAFIVESALSADAVETNEDRKQLIVQLYQAHTLLARISNNVNQIARATNATGEYQKETGAALAAVRKTADRIEALCDELSLS